MAVTGFSVVAIFSLIRESVILLRVACSLVIQVIYFFNY